MKFVKSLSLPVLSLALLMPMANACAYEAKAPAQKWYQTITEKAGQAGYKARELAGTALDSAKARFNEMPTFEQMRVLAANKLGLQDKSVTSVFKDAKDAVITYGIRHPWVVLSAVAVTAGLTGFAIARMLSKKKK